jgi:hypothetical protein
VKRGDSTNYPNIYSVDGEDFVLRFTNSDVLEVYSYGTGYNFRLLTNAVYRDSSAWYHILLAYDSTQATDSDRISLYVNGSKVTSFGSTTWPSLNYQSGNSATAWHIGNLYNTYYFDGYLADVHFIDGQALDHTDFGEFDDNGVWQPIAYAGTYGTNGFHLDFSDNSSASALGYDAAGSNNWTVNNITPPDTGTSISSATGAKPIFATTDSFGQTVGTGLAADGNASNLELCAPLTDGSGAASMTDQSPTGRTSSTLTLTNNDPSLITVNTTTGHFYGESLNFSGAHAGVDVASIGIWNSDFTLEGWFRRTGTAALQTIFDTWYNQTSGVGFYIWWDGAGLDVVKDSGTYYQQGSGTALPLNTWQHIALTRSGTTIKIYLDGTQYMSFTPSDSTWTSSKLRIGDAVTNGGPFVGQIQDVRAYSNVKYTANFTVPAAPISSPDNDSFFDSPTNGTQEDTGAGGEVSGNYCTLNPIAFKENDYGTFSQGNLTFTTSSDAQSVGREGTIAVSSGKWYWELAVDQIGTGTSANQYCAGVVIPGYQSGRQDNALLYRESGSWNNDIGATLNVSSPPSYQAGDLIGFALDLDNNKFYVAKNGVWAGSGDPANNTNPSATLPAGLTLTAGLADYWATSIYTFNFGQRPFAYAAPSGYKALCTANLDDPTIADGSTAFDAVTYTGNSSTNVITGLNFSPDFLWIKARTVAGYDSRLIDSVRGADKLLYSSLTSAEATGQTNLTSFDSNGFTLGANSQTNLDTYPFIAWTWDAGTSTVSNTDGTITSSVRANPSAGFSIVSYTGNGTAGATVGHGLNAEPSMVITKTRETAAANNWTIYHKSIGNTKAAYFDTNSFYPDAGYWNNTSPTSSVVTLGNYAVVNASSKALIMYAFAPVEGYSAFGSYTGNGSTDGTFVYTGFRPAFIIVKRSDSTGSWGMFDSSRDTYNVADSVIFANLSDAEATSTFTDFLSNGFKFRSTSNNWNGSGGTYIYAAFAENPFKTARAR